MFWHRLQAFLFSGGMLATVPTPVGSVERASLNEILSHECGRAVAGLVEPAREPGPLFGAGDLLFTSLEDTDNHPQLLVSAGDGVFRVELIRAGLNRLRFDLTDPSGSPAVTYYLSYLHDPKLGSRYLEFAVNRPPDGHFELDYLTVVPRRAKDLLPHLDYAIFVTSERVRRAVTEGRLTRAALRPPVAGACDHLRRDAPDLARQIDRNLDQLGVYAAGPARWPAALR